MTKLILPLLMILCVVGCGEGSHLPEIEEAKAQNMLGFYYQFGAQEVEQDFKEAVTWHQKAADQELPEAQCSLGEMYNAGKGEGQKEPEADSEKVATIPLADFHSVKFCGIHPEELFSYILPFG